MAQDPFNRDFEQGSTPPMAQDGLNGQKSQDGRKRVLIVGAGAAG